MKLCACLILSVLLISAEGLKILAILPVQSRSHFNAFEPLWRHLARKGHQVTLISFFDPYEKEPNLELIKLVPPPSEKEVRPDKTERLSFAEAESFSSGPAFVQAFACLYFFNYFSKISCSEVLASEELRNFIQEDRHYDVVLNEAFSTTCFVPFARRYNAVSILYSTSALLPWYYSPFGEPDNGAYIPTSLSAAAPKMDFLQRVSNTFTHLIQAHLFPLYNMRSDQYWAENFFGDDTPDLKVLLHNASLILMNTHYSFHGARPHVPASVEVGGIHVDFKPKPLPKNIENWINESEHGVIYFSMGSMIKGHTFPEDKRKIFLRAFGRLKQRVLWKWENDTMPGKPDNVMIQKWMPQFDILCHPNVKAFISHGGLLGTTEAVHCGVPVVVMPQFGDQHTNAKALEAGNGGVILNFREADEEAVYKALTTVLDPEFNKKAKELSARFRDRPMSPMDTAIYWIEYVARHKGAHHMRTAAVGMPLYQYLLLDVFAFLALVAIVALLVVFYTLKFLLSFLKSFFVPQKKLKSQ